MTREWKPGDAVSATVNGRPNVRLIAGWSKYDPQLRWGELSTRWADGDDDESWFMPSQVSDHRRLAVIDPEDREQVNRLDVALAKMHFSPANCGSFGVLQAALREFANPTPPKPDEPTGLGAVVEAIYDNRFVRVASCDEGWMRVDERQPALLCTWHDIDVVRVLSEGVQP